MMKQYRCVVDVSERVVVVVQAGDEAQAQVLGDLAARDWRDRNRRSADVLIDQVEIITPVPVDSHAWETLSVSYAVFE